MFQGQTVLASVAKIVSAEIFEGHWRILCTPPASRLGPPLFFFLLSISAQLKAAIMLLTMFSCPHISASLAALIVQPIRENKGVVGSH